MSETAKDVVWDLSEFYTGIDDPKIDKDIKKVDALIDSFVKKYKGKINSKDLTAEFLHQAILDHEEIDYISANYILYASLLFSKNVLSEDVSIFYQKINEFSSEQSTKLTWFGVEWLHLDDVTANKVIANKTLKNYKHSLVQSRLLKDHTLSEKEETLLSKTSITGAGAFTKLFDLVDTDTKYELEIEGEIKQVTFSELSNYLSLHPDRDVRKRAAESLTAGLRKNEKIYAFIMNTLLLDSKISDEVRKFKYPQEATFLLDELEKEAIDTMTDEVVKGHPVVERFYNAKKKLLGIDELFEWDRYNSIYPDMDEEYTWEQAKEIVLKSFYGFNQKFGETAELFFDNNWIDAPLMDGKRSGAFCLMGTPKHHPFVFTNFKGKSRDVMELAHELGHAIHSYLSRNLTLAEYYPVTPLAEIASIFSEMLVFESLYKNAKDDRVKINLLGSKIQEIFASVFRQNAFYLFEVDVHKHRREKGEMSLENINSYFQKRLQNMFGEGLTLTDQHKYWWMYVSHFYHFDFYVYSYVFGELLTLALYQISKEAESFTKDYIELLSLGGSQKPEELLSRFKLDINSESFWSEGVTYIDKLVDEFESLTR